MSSKTLSSLLLARLIGGACAYADWPESRPPGGEIPAPHSPLESPEMLPSGPAISEPAGDLTLREVLSLALLQNPELKAFAFEVRAREAAVLHARLDGVVVQSAKSLGDQVKKGELLAVLESQTLADLKSEHLATASIWPAAHSSGRSACGKRRSPPSRTTSPVARRLPRRRSPFATRRRRCARWGSPMRRSCAAPPMA